MQNYARLGIFGVLALVGLRVGIGWHFYMEGASKVRGNDFSSVGFLQAAKGPLAEKFQGLIWDHDGSVRLDQGKINGLFYAAADKAAAHFSFTEDQKKQAEKLRKSFAHLDKNDRYTGKVNEVFADDAEDIYKYWESEERLARMDGAGMWNGVASLRGQKEKIKADRMAGVNDTLASVDAMWKQYEGRLNAIATPEQYKVAGYYYFARPNEGRLTIRMVDQIIPIFDMAVGILLMIGLLTPLAAWAAALFLISVILSQMPGYPGTQPTYFQAVEALALIVLATTDAGRYAGLDFIPWTWWQKRRAEPQASAA